MTDNTKLIAEGRRAHRMSVSVSPVTTLYGRLTDALEAADLRITELEAENAAWENVGKQEAVIAERELRLAAVIEQIRAMPLGHFGTENYGYDGQVLDGILAAADTDAALREHDEAVRQEVYRTVNLHPHAAAKLLEDTAASWFESDWEEVRAELRARAAAIREARS